MSPTSLIEQAFAQSPDITQRVTAAIAKSPELSDLFEAIAQHVKSLQPHLQQYPAASLQENPSKKRKLDSLADNASCWDNGTFQSFNDISFSIPQRKKLRLDIGKLPYQGLRGTNPTGNVETFAKWTDIREIVCLPIPEKAHAHYNFCVFASCDDAVASDQMLWSVPNTIPKEGAVSLSDPIKPGDTYKSLLITTLNKCLKPYKKQTIEPNDKEFSSQLAQAHRKGETAYHIKAFRGAKDGFLFLLSTGIVWGFKKPLEFFPFDVIDSVSYTSVLQRTFNLNIAIRKIAAAEVQEFEFSMIDQADFTGIDAYVKRHALQDASMAEQRRAKKLNVNGTRAEYGDQAGKGVAGGELERAAHEAQDLEDEDEDEEEDENFDPGSEGESEGEGDSSGEDEMGNGLVHGGDDDMGEEELGSEAEDAI
ncbi:MAG: hypothetical protein Q9217_006741 [Psora testacea]